MSTASIKLVPIGSTISFRSKNPNDPTLYEGVLESIGSYRSILSYFNPDSYNQAVRQVDTSVSTDETLLTYFVVTITNNASLPTEWPFADEWISAGSLNILNLGNVVNIAVKDPTNSPQTIISILANAGYSATITG